MPGREKERNEKSQRGYPKSRLRFKQMTSGMQEAALIDLKLNN
jgi:hypothetical protein